MSLPTGLTIDRSVGPRPCVYDPDNLIWGCAISKTAAPIPIINPLKYWSSDFLCAVGSSQAQIDAATLHQGPFDTEQQARAAVDALLISELDVYGQDGVSLWLTLP